MRKRYLPSPPASSRPPTLTRSISSLAALTLLLITGSVGFSQEDAQDPFEDLRLRIAQLERDNRELRSALSKTPDDSFVPMISELPPKPEEYDDATKSPEDRKMESLVEGLIRRMNAQTQSMTDLQNQKIAALESQLKDLKKAPKPTSATGNFGNNGLTFTSADGNFKTHFGGTAQLDFIAPQSTASGISIPGTPTGTNGTQDSTTFRRLRTRADGTMYGWIDWASEFDFAMALQNTTQQAAAAQDNGLRSAGTTAGVANQQGGNTMNVIQPTTVFMTFKDTYVGNIRVGNQQDWFSLDHITSARYLDFMERAQIMDVFSGPSNNGYTPGVSVFNNTPDKMGGYQFGLYKNNAYDSGFTYSIGNAFEYGGRAFWLPYYDECSNGQYLIHTAFAAEYRSFNTDPSANQLGQNVRVRSRGDLRIASSTIDPNYSDSGNFFALGQTLIDPEIAVVWGPWTVKGEYTAGWFNGCRTTQLAGGTSLGTVLMTGGYIEALYALTGESAVYNRQTGVFGQFIPKNNVDFSKGQYGAWQVGGRYDAIDMNSGLVTGGRNQTGTLGVNWWINPMIRFQFNVVGAYINNAANPVIGGPVGSAATGTLQGSNFKGDGLIMAVGTRMDISF